MRALTIILLVFPLLLLSQESSEENAKSRKKQSPYFGVHTDLVFSRLEGIEGNERRQYFTDYIQDLNYNGIAAEGGLYGRWASGFGVFYDQFIGKRFALHIQADYLQTGYREKLTAIGSTDAGSIEHTRNFKARLDYLHFLGGVKYYNDFGVTVLLGAFGNYNLYDKIKLEENILTTGRFGTSEESTDADFFFHEYYGENRTIFLTGAVFGIGYRWQRFEFDFNFKASTQILSETDDMYYYIYQTGIKYQLTGFGE